MILIKTKPYNLPSYSALKEFEDSFSEQVKREPEINSRIIKKVLQAGFKYFPEIYSWLRNPGNQQDVFSVLMAAQDIYRLIPYGLKAGSVHLYIYDLWDHEYIYFEKAIRALKINTVFFSSLQTKNYFEKLKDINTNFIWLPEAIKLEKYQFKDYAKKDIDILCFGRKYEKYHQAILPYTREQQIKYFYPENNQLLFKNDEDLADGLSRAKISLCFPLSVTHPELASNISKVTMRYFQSMASKCLVLGNKPDDITELFDYNPVIEIDEKQPVEQIKEILDNYEQYIPLIEKNYANVIKNHQYIHRIEEIFRNLAL